MGAREAFLASALMAIVNRSLATSCLECYWDNEYENGTGAYYTLSGWGVSETRSYCSDPTTCSYGLTSADCGCCKVCAKGPGEACGGEWDQLGRCSSDLVCQRPGYTNRNIHYSSYDSIGTCVNKTTPAAECPPPWFLLKNPGRDLTHPGRSNSQCLRVVSGEAKRRSSISANAYCGHLTMGADLAQPKNIRALIDHLRENNFTDTYWYATGYGPRNAWGPDGDMPEDVENCTLLWPENGLGYGVHHLNGWSCDREISFICERHYRQGWRSIFYDYYEN